MINGDFSPLPENLKDALDNRTSQLKLVAGRRQPLHRAEHDGQAVRRPQRPQGRQRRHGPQRAAPDARRQDRRRHRDALPPAGHRRLRRGRRHEGHRRRLPVGRRQAAARSSRAEYFKKAGFASGKYEGTEKILMVGSNAGVAAKTAEVAKENLEKMGFKIQMRLVQPQTMYTRYCNTPSAKVAICPNVGWIRDFADGQTMLSPTFAGKNILEQGNSNWPQLNDAGDQQRDRRRPRSLPPTSARRLGRRSTSRSPSTAPGDPVAVGQDPADRVRRTSTAWSRATTRSGTSPGRRSSSTERRLTRRIRRPRLARGRRRLTNA